MELRGERVLSLAAFLCAVLPSERICEAQFGHGGDPFCDNTCPDVKDHFKTLGCEDLYADRYDVAEKDKTMKALKSLCRRELAKNHPDKQQRKSEEERAACAKRYIAVQDACQVRSDRGGGGFRGGLAW